MRRLPLLVYVSEQLYPDTRLDEVLVIACQHILGTMYDLFEELFAKGLKPENLYLLGKCYSTHVGTFEKLEKRGVRISHLSKAYESHMTFDEQFREYLRCFFGEMMDEIDLKAFKRIIVLDDGGGLLLHINDLFHDFSNIIGIEQTSSGFHKLEPVELHFPTINVARSQAKLEIESPMIAEATVRRLKRYIQKESRILVVGQGYIGRCVQALLKKDHSVNGCDTKESLCDFGGNYKENFSNFDVFIGATGQGVLEPKELSCLKKGSRLISVSSSDREFPSAHLRTQLPISTDCHADIEVGGILLLNSGFPINFDGGENSMTPEQSQFTRALLFAAICQAKDFRGERGWYALDLPMQERISNVFRRIVKIDAENKE